MDTILPAASPEAVVADINILLGNGKIVLRCHCGFPWREEEEKTKNMKNRSRVLRRRKLRLLGIKS
jgi:hypothetical protein